MPNWQAPASIGDSAELLQPSGSSGGSYSWRDGSESWASNLFFGFLTVQGKTELVWVKTDIEKFQNFQWIDKVHFGLNQNSFFLGIAQWLGLSLLRRGRPNFKSPLHIRENWTESPTTWVSALTPGLQVINGICCNLFWLLLGMAQSPFVSLG